MAATMRSHLISLAALALTWGPSLAGANSAGRSFTATTWRVEEGLPEDTVQAFAQTPDGYLWIGTNGGLARFDGTHFAVYNSDNTPVFRENSVHCLTVARDGSLWIGMEGSGLIHLSHGEFRVWAAADGLTDMFVHAVAEDRAGTLWIGTNNGFFRLAQGRVLRIDGTNGIPSLAVNAIQEDPSGRIWIGGSRLMSIDKGVFKEHELPGELSRNRIKSLAVTRDGDIWVGTVSGLYRSAGGSAPFRRVPGVHGTVRALRQDHDGTLWMSIVGLGAEARALGHDSRLSAPALRVPGAILSIFEDEERNIWVGSQSGMTRYSETPVSIVPVPDFRNSDFSTVYLDRDGTLWSAGTRLVRISGGHAEPYVFPALHGAKVRNLLRDRDGSLWIGTDGSGLFHLTSKNARRYTTVDGLVNNFIRVMVQARDGSLWIGTDEGISHLDNGRFRNYGIRDGLAYFSIRSMIEDSRRSLWIGTDLGLSHLVDGKFAADRPVAALRQDKVWAIHEDSDGGLWFGTRNHGLYRWRDGTLTRFTTADGLASNGIYSILEDAAGHFWMSGPESVSLLNRHELDAFADLAPVKRTHLLALGHYSLPGEDGPSQIFGGVQSAGAIAPGGDVWFPGNRGPVHVSLPRSEPAPMPPLIVDRVNADHLAAAWRPGDSRVLLGPANSRLDISYEPLMLSSQQNVRFRYKLEGFDREWIDALGRHDTSYTSLPPGRYVFRIAAFRTSDPGTFSEVSLAIVKAPFFYRRWWFVLCAALTLLSLAAAIYRARVGRIRQRFLGVLEERNRIAREIHDTVIQGCTSISAVLEALTTIASAEKRESLLDRARTQIRSTIDEARAAVWNLRREAAPAAGLDAKLSAMCSQIGAEFGVDILCAVSGKPFPMNRQTMHETLMIVREALHNAAVHAATPAIEVNAAFSRGGVSIRVADDGKGFDPESAFSTGRHYGLLGMKERALRLDGEIEFVSRPGQGTCVILRIPRRRFIREASLAEKVGTL